MSDNNENLSWKFYALLSTASIGLITGMYFLYSVITENMDLESEISEDQKEKLEELVKLGENMEDNNKSPKEKQNSENTFTIKIYKQIHALSEDTFKKENPEWLEKRRQLLKDNKKQEYNNYCENILAEKMRLENLSAEIVLNKLGINQIEFQQMMEKIPQNEMMLLQQQMLQSQRYSLDNNRSYSNEEIIKAFKEFLKIKNQMDSEFKNMGQIMNENSEEARMQYFMKLEINKFMIDDCLLNYCELDFAKMLEIINSRSLFNNPEITEDYRKIMQEFSQGGY